jgi:purine nucleoside phosphorylase
MSTPSVSVQRLALIGGSSFLESSALTSFIRREISTPHGPVLVYAAPSINADGSSNIYFVQRHAANPDADKKYSPPHLINYRAIVTALQQLVS